MFLQPCLHNTENEVIQQGSHFDAKNLNKKPFVKTLQ